MEIWEVNGKMRILWNLCFIKNKVKLCRSRFWREQTTSKHNLPSNPLLHAFSRSTCQYIQNHITNSTISSTIWTFIRFTRYIQLLINWNIFEVTHKMRTQFFACASKIWIFFSNKLLLFISIMFQVSSLYDYWIFIKFYLNA